MSIFVHIGKRGSIHAYLAAILARLDYDIDIDIDTWLTTMFSPS